MVKNQEINVLIKRGLINEIEGLFLEQRMRRASDNLVSALALAGFKDPEPFVEALELEKKECEEPYGKGDFLPGSLVDDMTFDTFVTANNNVSAVEQLLRVCRNSPFKSNFLCIYGADGQGKTHLLNATVREIKRFHPEHNVVLANMVDLAIALIRASGRGVVGELIDVLAQVDTLLIDDVQFCEADSHVQTFLFDLMEERRQHARRVLIVSSDVTPGQLQLTEARLKSAMEKITVGELTPPDMVERMQMIFRFAGGIILPAEVRKHLAENVTGSIRELKAAVTHLVAIHRDRNREITLELAKDILCAGGIVGPPGPENTAGSGVATARGSRTGNSYAQLLKEMIRSARDSKEHALANQIALSQMIKRLGYGGSASSRPVMARLHLALEAIREGDLATASVLMQGDGAPARQGV